MGSGTSPYPSQSSLEFRAFQGDPIGRILLGRLRLSPTKLALGSLGCVLLFGAASIPVYALPFVSGNVLEALSAAGWVPIVYALTVIPLAFGFYAWISIESGRLYARLHAAGVFEMDEQSFRSTLVGDAGYVRSTHSAGAWAAAGGAITLLVLLVWVVDGARTGAWSDDDGVLWALFVPLSTLGVYMVCMVAARQFSNVMSLWHIFRTCQLRLRPFHPDRAGGLSPLSEFTIAFGYFLALAGFGLALLSIQSQADGRFSSDYLLHVGLGLYIVLAPLTFFGMLGSAHQAMDEAKARWLAWISNQFDEDYVTAIGALNEESKAFAARLEKVSHLHSLYRLTEAFPVWPFDTATIRRFAAVLAAPLATVAGTAIANAVIRIA